MSNTLALEAEAAQPVPMPEFIQRTNEEYAAWCKTYYSADSLDHLGMVSLHGLWAWQEQERRKAIANATPT